MNHWAYLICIPFIAGLWAWFTILGQALLPKAVRDSENRLFCLLIAPATGVCVWLPVTLFLIGLFGGARYVLSGAAVASLLLIWHARRNLHLPELRRDWLWLLPALLVMTLVMIPVLPRFIDGGLYFSDAVYDHTKSALIDSIARSGLPSLSPFLADAGKPVVVAYYYGWHALASQICILTGGGGYFADLVLTGFSGFIIFLTMAAFAFKFSQTRISILFLTVFAIFTQPLTYFIPGKIFESLFGNCTYSFWGWQSQVSWVPQHAFAGTAVLLTVYWLFVLLTQKTDWKLWTLTGATAATAFFCSVYAGTFALVLFGCGMGIWYLFSKKLRAGVNRNWMGIAVATAVGLCLSLGFFRYLFQYRPSAAPLVFGAYFDYRSEPFLPVIWRWLHFYGLLLPWRLGLIYLVAAILFFRKKFISGTGAFLADLWKVLFAVTFLSIFWIRSSFYSNDFGWRVILAGTMVAMVFTSVWFAQIYLSFREQRIWNKRKFGTLAILLIVPLYAVGMFSMAKEDIGYTIISDDAETHRIFARSAKGWEKVREVAGTDELVLSNPAGFSEVNFVTMVDRQYATNVFFALYARRGSPISDLIFSQCYSEFYDPEN